MSRIPVDPPEPQVQVVTALVQMEGNPLSIT